MFHLKGTNMRLITALLGLTFLIISSAFVVSAQENNAFETAQKLRAELSDVQNREAELKIRLDQLNYDLKPENIQNYFAGYGSVHPEELREARRKQLQTEKDRIVSMLSELEASRGRLESAISVADAKAYQQSALGSATLKPDATRRARIITTTRVLFGGIALFFMATGAVLFVARRRRQSA